MRNKMRNGRENDSFLTLFRMACGFEVSKLQEMLSFNLKLIHRISMSVEVHFRFRSEHYSLFFMPA